MAKSLKIGDRVRFSNGDWSPDDMIVVDIEWPYVSVAYQDRRLTSIPLGGIQEERPLILHLERVGE